MSVDHDIWAAVPPTGGAAVSKSGLRNTITARMPYVLADDDNPSELVCVDPETGSAIIDIMFHGFVFHYDPTDLVTDADGTTVLVSFEGRRYKLTEAEDVIAYSVLDNDLTAPPEDDAIGDAHLVAAGATGDWAGMDGRVAVLTARGYVFIIFGIGRAIYVESLDAYYHRKSTGEWVVGLGNLTIGSQSVPLSATINFGNRIIVENQTTNAPPGTAAVGTAYIIGSSPTGTWAGNSLKVAICEVANTFTIYTPSAGWSIYDKSTSSAYTWNGTAWLSTAGTWIDRKSVSTASGSTTAPSGTTSYTYSSSTAPTTSVRRLIDTATLSFTAKKSGATIRLHYLADVTYTTGGASEGSGDLVIAVFRDSGTNAVAWQRIPIIQEILTGGGKSMVTHLDHWLSLDAPDASSHTYTVALISRTSGTNQQTDATPTRRYFEIEEAA